MLNPIFVDIGKALRSIRIDAGLSVSQMISSLGYDSDVSIHDWIDFENGIKAISTTKIDRIANVYKLDYSSLLDGKIVLAKKYIQDEVLIKLKVLYEEGTDPKALIYDAIEQINDMADGYTVTRV